MLRIHGLFQRLLVCAVILLAMAPVHAAERFVVGDIEMTGLQRISEGTVLNYLPVRVGDTVGREEIQLAVKALYRAGFFHDIRVRRDGNALVFVFSERPTIAAFSISGNKDIPTEQLEKILRENGLAEGRVLDKSVLELMEAELQRVYHGNGKYNAAVKAHVTELQNNLVSVSIVIKEGQISSIKSINIVGNEVFSEDRLKEEFELGETQFWSWLSSDDKYSREKLVGDLERLRSFYYDRGYADFEVENVMISLSPDRRDVYIMIEIREGDVYTVSENKLRGELIVPEEELRPLILLKEGDTFSMRVAQAGAQFIVRRLEMEGYAFAKVEPIPTVDRDSRTVEVTYRVVSGRRAYVRSILFKGAPGTNDEVFRREMRIFEGAWLNNARVERSKVRLERLPFIERVQVETQPVLGSTDEVDVIFDLEERNAGEFQVGVGYAGSTTGVMGNISVSHANVFGTGDSLNLGLVSSSFSNSFSLTHRDPFATEDGVGRSVSLFYRDQGALGRRLEQFDTTSFGGSLDYSYPISEFSSIGWGVAASDNRVTSERPGGTLPTLRFLTSPQHGDVTITPLSVSTDSVKLHYSEFSVNGRLISDTRNRSIFATRGSRREIGLTLATPPGDVEYYRASVEQRNFFPLGAGFTFTTRVNVGIAEAMGDSIELPPGRRFYAGGFDTIRGFRESYLGPKDESVFDESGDLVHFGRGLPVGGKLKTFLQTDLLIPNLTGEDPFAPAENTQFSLFIDAGNVFLEAKDFDVDEFRVSTGIAATFLTPIGALRFSLGYPLIEQEGDQTERLQFTVGTIF